MTDECDKLKLLANDMQDYVRALIIKKKQAAAAIGHELSDPIMETGGFQSPNAGMAYMFKNYHLTCTKCTYAVVIEHLRCEDGEEKIIINYEHPAHGQKECI